MSARFVLLILMGMTLLSELQLFGIMVQPGQFHVKAAPVEEMEICYSRSNSGREVCLLVPSSIQQRAAKSTGRFYGKRSIEPFYGPDILAKLTRPLAIDQPSELINQLLSDDTGFTGFSDDMSHSRFNPMRGKRNNQ